MKTYNWATYGTGVIANQLAQAMASQGRKLYSVSNRTYAKGVAFAEKYNISKIYDNPEDVFTDENVDIIYISTPHNTHLPLLLKDLAGGAMLDIGVYALSFVRWFMSSAPDQILSQVKLAPTGVDEQATILLSNQEQEMATITLSLHAKQPKRGLVIFEKGYIEVYEYPRAEKAVITYTESGKKETIEAGSTVDALLYEVLDMEAAVSGEKDVTETLHLDYTKDVMQVMTKCREDWGMKYPEEECYR